VLVKALCILCDRLAELSASVVSVECMDCKKALC
jgi:hypothetical protein